MPTVTLESVKGRDLAERLTKALRLEPERVYRITVHAEDEELAEASSLQETMDVVGIRAKGRGMNPDVLRDILDDV